MAAFNLSWVTEQLAIGGSFACERAAELVEVHRVGAVIDLRAEACDDEAVLAGHGLAFLHLPTDDHAAVSAAMLRDGVEFASHQLDAGRRVLVHCEHGIGRSATLALCVLVARGLEPLEALLRAKDRRALLSPSPPQYEAWAAWLRGHQRATGARWTIPDFDAFAAIAYRHVYRPR